MQVFEILQCDQGVECLNSLTYQKHGSAKCGICRYAPNNDVPLAVSYWKSIDPKKKHRAAVEAKKVKKQEREIELRIKKRSRDVVKRKVSVLAARAEKQTASNFFRATKNSGRSNKDGDHKAVGQITLDTKLQSKVSNPRVLLSELEKVREDAVRAGTIMGGLVLRNKHGVGVVVLREDDFARLISRLL